MSELDEAIFDYLGGDIDDARLQELDRRLREDPAAARRFAQLCDHEIALGSALRMSAPTTTRGGSPLRPAARHPRATALIWPWAAMAALVAIAIGSAWVSLRADSPAAAIAIIRSVRGDTRCARAGRSIAVVDGFSVRADDHLLILPGAAAELDYADGSTVTIGPDSELATGSGPAKRLALLHGSLTATVAKQPVDAPMTIVTATAEARVVGTRLRIAVAAGSTRLDVLEGLVRLLRTSDGASVEVPGGSFAIAEPGARFEVQSAGADDAPHRDPPLPDDASILFRERFSPTTAGWTGTLGTAPGDPPDALAIASAATQPGTVFFGEVRSGLDPRGWPEDRATFLRFRYRADGFARDDLLKVMLKRGDENNYGGFFHPALDRWTTVIIRLDDDIVYVNDHDQRLQPGQVIRELIWLGVAPDAQPTAARFWIDDVVVFRSAIATADTRLSP